MAYTTNQLISAAYYASGVVSREFETVSGSQVADGLQWLNDILTDKRIDKSMVPYEQVYSQPFQAGVNKYFIPNLIEIDTIVFYLNTVRYPMKYDKRNNFFGSPRVENIQSLTFSWYFERQVGGGNLHVYFSPDQNYPMEIHGTFNIDSVSLGQNLLSNVTTADLGVPKFYTSPTDLLDSFIVVGGSLAPGQFVINTVDLAGYYPNIGALLNHMNSGIIPGVQVSINVNDFVLTSTTEPPVPIYVSTSGFTNGTSFIGNVAAATTVNLSSTYFPGSDLKNQGVGAYLESPAPAVLTIDGYAVQLGDRVLVKNQTLPFKNGCYVMTTLGTGGVPWTLTRTANYDEPKEIGENTLFTVTNGNANGGTSWYQTQIVSAVGDDSINFLPFSAITFSNFSTIESPLYEVFNAGGFDQFYITYLRYALADRICTEYNFVVPPGVAKQLAEYDAWIRKKSRVIDLQMQKTSTLQRRNGFGWCYINLGRGFVGGDW